MLLLRFDQTRKKREVDSWGLINIPGATFRVLAAERHPFCRNPQRVSSFQDRPRLSSKHPPVFVRRLCGTTVLRHFWGVSPTNSCVLGSRGRSGAGSRGLPQKASHRQGLPLALLDLPARRPWIGARIGGGTPREVVQILPAWSMRGSFF